jgi:steroid delta-isomerase-like uncharacterized protein
MPLSPEAVVRTWFETLWNQGDEATIDRLMHPDATIHGLPTPDGAPIRGAGGFKPFYRAFRTAMPDMSIKVIHVVAEGDCAVAHFVASGTHRGEGLDVPPTNRRAEFTGMALARVADGQIVEGWNCVDFLAMYRQLGVQLSPSASSRTSGA